MKWNRQFTHYYSEDRRYMIERSPSGGWDLYTKSRPDLQMFDLHVINCDLLREAKEAASSHDVEAATREALARAGMLAQEITNNTEEEKTMTREEKKITRQNIHTAVELHQQHRWTGPVETVAALVLTLGYPAAVETVATLVNSVGDWDNRISTEARTWAADRAADRETLRAAGIYQPSEIHPAHIDQIAREMMAYAPAWEDQEPAPAEEIAAEEPDEETRKAAALAAYLVEYENFTEDEAAEIERNYDGSFSCGSWEYQVMTDEEADEAARSEILESLWAFRPEFILSHMHDHGPTSVREDEAICKALRIMQEELCESATPIMRALIADLDDFVSDAIQADGRGHFISRYDGDEIELGEFYAYRRN